jgi:hypothetical protein
MTGPNDGDPSDREDERRRQEAALIALAVIGFVFLVNVFFWVRSLGP